MLLLSIRFKKYDEAIANVLEKFKTYGLRIEE